MADVQMPPLRNPNYLRFDNSPEGIELKCVADETGPNRGGVVVEEPCGGNHAQPCVHLLETMKLRQDPMPWDYKLMQQDLLEQHGGAWDLDVAINSLVCITVQLIWEHELIQVYWQDPGGDTIIGAITPREARWAIRQLWLNFVGNHDYEDHPCESAYHSSVDYKAWRLHHQGVESPNKARFRDFKDVKPDKRELVLDEYSRWVGAECAYCTWISANTSLVPKIKNAWS
jgi:hypothetical protein